MSNNQCMLPTSRRTEYASTDATHDIGQAVGDGKVNVFITDFILKIYKHVIAYFELTTYHFIACVTSICYCSGIWYYRMTLAFVNCIFCKWANQSVIVVIFYLNILPSYSLQLSDFVIFLVFWGSVKLYFAMLTFVEADVAVYIDDRITECRKY